MNYIDIDHNTLDKTSKDSAKFINFLGAPKARKTIIEAGNQGAINALKDHFAKREQEPTKSSGFPWFGKPFPKQYFWSGARGVSLSENIRVAHSSPENLASKISIHSAALARKLNPNPRPITPKGGKKYLAIPAKPSAVLWKGMPRDFPGGLRLAYTKTPTGKWLPSLVAAANYLKKDGSISPSLKGSNHGMNDVVYCLVRKTNPKNDLNAIPHLSTLAASASKAIKTAIETLIKAL